MASDDDDVPIRFDFRDAATARTWIEDTRIRRPYRPRFFAAFCAALASRPRLRILELGSGPGQLAREILVHCDVQPLALARAGFIDVQLRYDEGNMALWCGTNPGAVTSC